MRLISLKKIIYFVHVWQILPPKNLEKYGAQKYACAVFFKKIFQCYYCNKSSSFTCLFTSAIYLYYE